MRAGFITGHGGNEVVEIGQRPKPERQPGEVLIRVKAAGLNRVDLYMRDSGAGITHALPQIMGLDAAGIVEEADNLPGGMQPGDKVVIHPGIGCGRCEFCQRGEHVLCTSMKFIGEHRDGTFAEFVCLPAENVFPMPATLDFAEAAALCCSYATAWRMVFGKAQLKSWETVLIFGIGGSVSLAAMQLAKMIGARTIVTSRVADKLAQAKELGADEVIDSSKLDVAKTALKLTGGRGVDAVIENIGEAVWPHALKSLVRGGRVVTCGATSGDNPSADLRRMFIRQLQVIGSTHSNFAEFRDMLTACERGLFKPVLESRYTLSDLHTALNKLESGEQFGKIAIEID